MGGKTKILDQQQLETLYVESRLFAQKTQDGIEKIQGELNKLNDPDFQSGLSGGQGEAAKDAIKAVSKAVEQLKGVLDKTGKFIDTKLAGAAVLAKDKHGMGDTADKGKNIASNMSLRK